MKVFDDPLTGDTIIRISRVEFMFHRRDPHYLAEETLSLGVHRGYENARQVFLAGVALSHWQESERLETYLRNQEMAKCYHSQVRCSVLKELLLLTDTSYVL